MFGLQSRLRKKRISIPRHRARLGVEQLETRYCPSGLQFTSFSAAPMNSGKWVDLQGVISDPSPTTVIVSFSGVASGSVNPNSSGYFDFETIASGLGNVTASGTDASGLHASASATLSANAPLLSLNLAYGPNRQVTLSGQVTDAQPGGLVVTFTGVASGTATTKSDGTYSVTLTASSLGQITATTTNVWGLTSSSVPVTVSNPDPTITLYLSQVGSMATFSGRVTDNYAPGLTVTFSGPPDINGKTVTVQNDGTYSLTTQLASSDSGAIYASVIDWWGDEAVASVLLPTPTKQ